MYWIKLEQSLLIIASFVLLFSCKYSSTNELKVKKQNLEGGELYHFHKGDSILLTVTFSDSNKLICITNFPKNHDQVIYFYAESGTIESILKKDRKSLNTFGRAYYFYDTSGNLAGDYNYINGIKQGSAVSYHDSTDRVKSVMLYNDQGELYYRKTFDRYGNHIKTEGSKN